MKKVLFERVTAPIQALFNKANALNVNLFERLQPTYHFQLPEGNTLKFSCPNQMSLWRAKTLLDKEPDTIKWINSFQPTDIMYDVGANVGVFTLYAASKDLTVYAFEPESQNYAALNRNIFLNQFQHHVHAFNLAISDQAKMGHLYLKEFTIGGALNNFGECINYQKEAFTPGFQQAVAAFPLDMLINQFKLPRPHHLKIDVDGLEAAVVAGAENTLQHPQLKSLLIELNTDLSSDLNLIPLIKHYGFELSSHYRSPAFANSPFKNIFNHIFTRPS